MSGKVWGMGRVPLIHSCPHPERGMGGKGRMLNSNGGTSKNRFASHRIAKWAVAIPLDNPKKTPFSLVPSGFCGVRGSGTAVEPKRRQDGNGNGNETGRFEDWVWFGLVLVLGLYDSGTRLRSGFGMVWYDSGHDWDQIWDGDVSAWREAVWDGSGGCWLFGYLVVYRVFVVVSVVVLPGKRIDRIAYRRQSVCLQDQETTATCCISVSLYAYIATRRIHARVCLYWPLKLSNYLPSYLPTYKEHHLSHQSYSDINDS